MNIFILLQGALYVFSCCIINRLTRRLAAKKVLCASTAAFNFCGLKMIKSYYIALFTYKNRFIEHILLTWEKTMHNKWKMLSFRNSHESFY